MEGSDILLETVVPNSVAFLLGVLSSFLVWWFLNKTWVPRIQFAEEICRYSVGSQKKLYVCAFENAGSRGIVDAEVIMRFGVRKFQSADGWIYFSIETNASRIPLLEPGRRSLVRIFDERVTPAFIDQPPPTLLEMIQKCRTLEDIFDISGEVSVQMHVFGFDTFSGVRHHYASPTYSQNDIRSGRFKGLVVVGTKML